MPDPKIEDADMLAHLRAEVSQAADAAEESARIAGESRRLRSIDATEAEPSAAKAPPATVKKEDS